MLVSFVLRLRADQLAGGRMVGQVEEVDSGRNQSIRSTADLLRFCSQYSGLSAPIAGTPHAAGDADVGL